MVENFGLLVSRSKKAASLLSAYAGQIRVFGQYDADGITATSILIKTLLREAKSFHARILKQLTENNLSISSPIDDSEI